MPSLSTILPSSPLFEDILLSRHAHPHPGRTASHHHHSASWPTTAVMSLSARVSHHRSRTISSTPLLPSPSIRQGFSLPWKSRSKRSSSKKKRSKRAAKKQADRSRRKRGYFSSPPPSRDNEADNAPPLLPRSSLGATRSASFASKLQQRFADWRSKRRDERGQTPTPAATHKRAVSLPLLEGFDAVNEAKASVLGGMADPFVDDAKQSYNQHHLGESTDTAANQGQQHHNKQSPSSERLIIPRVIAHEAGPVHLPQQGCFQGSKPLTRVTRRSSGTTLHHDGLGSGRVHPAGEDRQHQPHSLRRSHNNRQRDSTKSRRRGTQLLPPSSSSRSMTGIGAGSPYTRAQDVSRLTLINNLDDSPSLYSEVTGFTAAWHHGGEEYGSYGYGYDYDGSSAGHYLCEEAPPQQQEEGEQQRMESQALSVNAAEALQDFFAATRERQSFDVAATATEEPFQETEGLDSGAYDGSECHGGTVGSSDVDTPAPAPAPEATTTQHHSNTAAAQVATAAASQHATVVAAVSTSPLHHHPAPTPRVEDPFALDESTITFWLESERSLSSIATTSAAAVPLIGRASSLLDPFADAYDACEHHEDINVRRAVPRPLSPVHSEYSWVAVYSSDGGGSRSGSGSGSGSSTPSSSDAGTSIFDGSHGEAYDDIAAGRHIRCHWSPHAREASLSSFMSQSQNGPGPLEAHAQAQGHGETDTRTGTGTVVKIPKRRSSRFILPAPAPATAPTTTTTGSGGGQGDVPADESVLDVDLSVSYWCATQQVLEDYLPSRQSILRGERASLLPATAA